MTTTTRPGETVTVTAADLRTLLDIAVNSLGFGSRFWDSEETDSARRIAIALGVNPMEATPNDLARHYPHDYQAGARGSCVWCRCTPESWPHQKREDPEKATRAEVAGSESVCHRCHGPNIVWSAPSPLWNEVVRAGDINARGPYDEIICPTCFCVLAQEQDVAFGWRLIAEQVRVQLATITPSGRVWNEETWLWEEQR